MVRLGNFPLYFFVKYDNSGLTSSLRRCFWTEEIRIKIFGNVEMIPCNRSLWRRPSVFLVLSGIQSSWIEIRRYKSAKIIRRAFSRLVACHVYKYDKCRVVLTKSRRKISNFSVGNVSTFDQVKIFLRPKKEQSAISGHAKKNLGGFQ